MRQTGYSSQGKQKFIKTDSEATHVSDWLEARLWAQLHTREGSVKYTSQVKEMTAKEKKRMVQIREA